MKILFYHLSPFAVAHGGLQIQILRTREALQDLGVDVEFLRWYDDHQAGDLLHFFGRVPSNLLTLAHEKKLKVVQSELLTEQGSRPAYRLRLQKAATYWLEKLLPAVSRTTFNWDSYRKADACIALTQWEAQLMRELFRAPKEKIHVVPNGVESIFERTPARARGPWLVCTATITERKRVLELAQAAALARTPVWIIGRPYSEADPYFKRFLQLAREQPENVRYEGPVENRQRLAEIYREARGFVLLSTMESLSLSALEAAACETPLLLSDLPWARTVFPQHARFVSVKNSEHRTSQALRDFYEAAPTLAPPPRPATWDQVAQQLKALYEGLLSTSR